MTNPTTHGQVPEALPAIQRFEVVDCIDSKHVPAVIPKPHGPWVRYEDHIAALAGGQATPAQPAPQQEVPAQPTEPREWAKIAAGYAHVDSMLQQADGERGGPFWHGWALREAFVAGAEWQEGRKRPAAPQPSPASQGDALDAARYRYLRDGDWREHEKLESVIRLQLNTLWDETIDAARAAQEGKSHD